MIRYKVLKNVTVTFLAGVMVAGCNSTIHKKASVDGIQTLSIDAKQRMLLVNDHGGPSGMRRVACAEPSPDALVAQAAALSANITTPKQLSAALAASNKESAGSIGLRTQTIQVLRDGYFRICEAFMNGSITSNDYKEVINNVDGVIAVVLAIETLGGTVTPPSIQLTPGAVSTSASGNNASVSGDAGTVIVEKIETKITTMSDKQASAIEKITLGYLSLVAARNAARLR